MQMEKLRLKRPPRIKTYEVDEEGNKILVIKYEDNEEQINAE